MICSQYLANGLQPDHASFSVVTAETCPRRKKGTLQLCFTNQIIDLLAHGCVKDVKEARKEIHTKALRVAVATRGSNGVLESAAPDEDANEFGLQMGSRTTLAQLRS